LAAVIDVTLLQFAYKRVAAASASHELAEGEIVTHCPYYRLTAKNRLHAVEERFRNKWSMVASEEFSRPTNANQSCVERIIQDCA